MTAPYVVDILDPYTGATILSTRISAIYMFHTLDDKTLITRGLTLLLFQLVEPNNKGVEGRYSSKQIKPNRHLE